MGSTKINIIKLFLSNFLYFSGFNLIARKVIFKNARYVLMFHGVSSKKSKNISNSAQPHLDVSQFESVVIWLKNNFNILDPNELINSSKPGILFTFDDGFQNNYTNVLPILEKYNIPGLFFITTQHVLDSKKWLHFVNDSLMDEWNATEKISEDIQNDYYDGINSEMLVKMSENPLVTIGSHTVTHPFLSQCEIKNIDYELGSSKEYLEKITNKTIKYLAYPSGDYDEKVIEIAKKKGYIAGFGIDRTNGIGFPNFEIPRVGIYYSNISYIATKLNGLINPSIKGSYLKIG